MNTIAICSHKNFALCDSYFYLNMLWIDSNYNIAFTAIMIFIYISSYVLLKIDV